MKNKILRNTILTLAVSSVMAVPTYAQDFNIQIQNTDIMPINYVSKHWSETYIDKLLVDFKVDEIFKDKNLDSYITVEDFNKAVKLVIDENYNGTQKLVSREAIVNELTKIWAEKVGEDLDNISIIKMIIYSDTTDIDVEYQHGVHVAYMKDIAKGKGNGVFDPNTNVTYGELAVLLNNTKLAVEKENANPIASGKYETKGSYEIKDGKVVFNFELMSHFTEAQELMFGSGQQFELIITNEDGEEVYKFSDGRAFTMALVYRTLAPGESFKWQDEWDMTNKDGEKLTSGDYKAEVKILAVAEEQKIEDEQLTTVIDFTLDNELND